MQTSKIHIDYIPDNVVIYKYEDNDFYFVDINKSAMNIEHVSKDIIGKKLVDIFPGVKEFGLYDLLFKAYETGDDQKLEMKFYEDSRISGWRENKIKKMPNGNLIVFYNDIHVNTNLESELNALHNLIDDSVNEIFIFDANTLLFSYANNAALKHIGYTKEELKLLTPIDIKPYYTRTQFCEIIAPLLSNEKHHLIFETKHTIKDGSTYDVEIRIQLTTIESKKQFIVFANDVSERKNYIQQLKENEEKLKKLATTDALTKINNRYKTNLEIDKQFSRSQRFNEGFSILMIDIDYFKKINDTYGHDIGDNVLKNISSLISNEIREIDCFGRWGGEEFLILLSHQKLDEAIMVATKIRKIIANYKFEKICSVTVSIGVSEYSKNDTKEALLKRADDAMYQAKEDGRNKISHL